MFQVTKCYIERENHCKLHAWCNFFSSLQRLNSMDAWKYACTSQTQSTQDVSNPCSYRIQILQYENMVVVVNSQSILQENKSGNHLFLLL